MSTVKEEIIDDNGEISKIYNNQAMGEVKHDENLKHEGEVFNKVKLNDMLELNYSSTSSGDSMDSNLDPQILKDENGSPIRDQEGEGMELKDVEDENSFRALGADDSIVEEGGGVGIEKKNVCFSENDLKDYNQDPNFQKEDPSFEVQATAEEKINFIDNSTESDVASDSEQSMVKDDRRGEETVMRGIDEHGVETTEERAGKGAGLSSQPKSIKPNSVIGKIKFAPLNVPIHRRRQTLVILINALLPFALQWFFFSCFLNPFLWPILIAYLIFIKYDHTPETGGRAVEWVRQLFVWKWYAEFFPAKLIAESALDPQRNYIFGYHPHGIISLGVFSNFATEASGVSSIFPGIKIRPLTLESNFRIPLYREFLLYLGFASVSRKSIANILGLGPGHSCLIVVGGAEEALESKPDSANLVLAHRLGFVRMAITQGADLVPVFGFGENQLYDQVDNKNGTWTRYIQTRLKQALGFTIPLFYGRGVFTYNFGILPHRLPLNVIVGSPISVQQNPDPSVEMVHAVHTQYLQALRDLYTRNKDAYWIGSNPPELNFI